MKPLIGLIRIRNEELILKDTLDHMAEFCDKIYLFDDASDDHSCDIYKNHSAVSFSIRNSSWGSNQMWIQGAQRKELFEYADYRHAKANFIYMDADERIDFDWASWDRDSAVIMNLFDARMTTEDCDPYTRDTPLEGFRKYFDPLAREIPFIFDHRSWWTGVACERYPQIHKDQNIIHAGHVQHYGKALSKQHWKDTCEYYVNYVPIYAQKWGKRKKETGVVSSDGLLTWDECKVK